VSKLPPGDQQHYFVSSCTVENDVNDEKHQVKTLEGACVIGGSFCMRGRMSRPTLAHPLGPTATVDVAHTANMTNQSLLKRG
jgi:hypothetical protein